MTGEDLDVWGGPGRPPITEASGQTEGPDEEGGEAREGRWRRLPVRWLVIPLVVIGMGAWINSYASVRAERDRALDELGRTAGQTRELELLRLENQFRSFDLLMLPEAGGLTASLGVVNVVNAEGHPRTWLLLRARGAEPGARYRLDIEPCPSSELAFPPFSARNEARADGDLEMTAQNLDVPTDEDAVVVVVRGREGEPLVGILGPLVRPRRIVTGAAASSVC